MKKYFVKIDTPNKLFFIKNKPVRTPTEFEIYENELNRVKMKILSESILDYMIIELDTGKEIAKPQKVSKQKRINANELKGKKQNFFESESNTVGEDVLEDYKKNPEKNPTILKLLLEEEDFSIEEDERNED